MTSSIKTSNKTTARKLIFLKQKQQNECKQQNEQLSKAQMILKVNINSKTKMITVLLTYVCSMICKQRITGCM